MRLNGKFHTMFTYLFLINLGSSTEKEVKISKPFHTEEEPDSPAKKQWKVGDKCLAIWSEDGQ